MKIKTDSDYKQIKPSVVTIGTFDGVHIGHQKIIKRLVTIAKEQDLQALVLTFFPHPRTVVQNDSNIKLINTIDEKAKQLEAIGVNHLVVKKFTKVFSRLTALEYVRDILVNKLKVKHIIVGYDHHFGRNRAANIEDLREYGDFYGFEVTEIKSQEIDDVAVSSTKIRNALNQGNIQLANKFLGYNYSLSGIVTKGKGIGSTINFPTANIYIKESYKLIPRHGVYLAKSFINESEFFGMINIGNNPTVSDNDKHIHIEIHFFNFNHDLYGEKIDVELLDYIRSEIKFSSIDSLKEQLVKDKKNANQRIDLILKM